MPRILVTGATGNVGSEVLAQLRGRGVGAVAGVHSIDDAGEGLKPAAKVNFESGEGPAGPFDAIFLVRPPSLTDPDLFAKFLEQYDRKTLVVFLSVQGADTKTYLPHARIEQVIRRMGFPHVFVRPTYFMDNVVTALWPDLERENLIYLPAGDLKFQWISARDVAAMAIAGLLGEVNGSALAAAGDEFCGFAEACAKVNAAVGTSIAYRSASLPGFLIHSKARGQPWSYIFVMLLLHYLPRFSGDNERVESDFERATGRQPETLEAFAKRNASKFDQLKAQN